VLAIGIAYTEIISASLFAWMINSLNKFMRKYDETIPLLKLGKEDVTLITDYIGEGYAYCTEQGLTTIDEMNRFEGIMLDPTYSAKGLGGGLDWLNKNDKRDKTVLFWNTYNSVDLSHFCSQIDYRTLPKVFHRYFETPTQEEEWV
jgi:1-aminocyclopropane-1-carboxylate deaminase/D-cysteine desulfhydrase-like pyridoxal-dependent ACC family enzyme